MSTHDSNSSFFLDDDAMDPLEEVPQSAQERAIQSLTRAVTTQANALSSIITTSQDTSQRLLDMTDKVEALTSLVKEQRASIDTLTQRNGQDQLISDAASAATEPSYVDPGAATPSSSLNSADLEFTEAEQSKFRYSLESSIARGAHPAVRKILAPMPSGDALGKAVIEIIKVQQAIRRAQTVADRKLVLGQGNSGSQKADAAFSSMPQAAQKVAVRFGCGPESDQQLLADLKLGQAISICRAVKDWTRLPFPVVVQLQSMVIAESLDLDEW